MASGTHNNLANVIINHLLRNQAFTPPATIYVALFTVLPTRSTTGTEVSTSGTAYARVAVTLSAAANGLTDNSATVTWAQATGSGFGTVVGVGFCISLAGALSTDLWTFANLTANQDVPAGVVFSIPANQLDWDFAATPA